MPLKANDYHNHLKLKTKAQICYFLLFLSVFFEKRAPTRHAGHDAPASLPLLRKQKAEAARESLAIPKQERTFAAAYGTKGMRPDTRASARMRTVSVT